MTAKQEMKKQIHKILEEARRTRSNTDNYRRATEYS